MCEGMHACMHTECTVHACVQVCVCVCVSVCEGHARVYVSVHACATHNLQIRVIPQLPLPADVSLDGLTDRQLARLSTEPETHE